VIFSIYCVEERVAAVNDCLQTNGMAVGEAFLLAGVWKILCEGALQAKTSVCQDQSRDDDSWAEMVLGDSDNCKLYNL
jgi:hypothetical protein